VQEVVIEEQVRSCLAQQVPCPHCGRPRRHKWVLDPSLGKAQASLFHSDDGTIGTQLSGLNASR
jgi:hypothetical protein